MGQTGSILTGSPSIRGIWGEAQDICQMVPAEKGFLISGSYHVGVACDRRKRMGQRPSGDECSSPMIFGAGWWSSALRHRASQAPG